MSKELSKSQANELIATLKSRFEKNMSRHKNIDWTDIESKIKSSGSGLKALSAMEETGGEPDVIAFDKKSGKITFADCSAESPAGRRSLCYDQEALDSRKENKPSGSAIEMAKAMGIEMLNETEYRELQQLVKFDLKTSSWIVTPEAIRKLGGSLFCDRRYNHVFTYHNGASSYYAARGFRGKLVI